MVAALVIQLTFRSPWEQAPVVAASADQLPVVPVR